MDGKEDLGTMAVTTVSMMGTTPNLSSQDSFTMYSEFDNFTSTPYPNFTDAENVTNSGVIIFYGPPEVPASLGTIVGLSILFCIIGIVGILGNSLVIIVIFQDRKMRQSVTNIFIMNLAIADLLIMVFGIPEIIQFMLNRGWVLGQALCKFNRYVLVMSLYTSVLSLVSVCIERFVAIVFPLKAQILCNRRKNIIVLSFIWPFALGCALPIALFNQVRLVIPQYDISFCMSVFPANSHGQNIYRYMEFSLFYLIPVCIQVVLYAIIGKRLYMSTDELHTKFQMRKEANCKTDRAAETIKARKGVVKMLMASVIIYIVCYAPTQLLTIYDIFSNSPFQQTWPFIAFVNVIGYVNSAANPVLYSIFSQNFRRNFKKFLACFCLRRQRKEYMRARFDSFDSRGVSRKTSTTRTTMSRV